MKMLARIFAFLCGLYVTAALAYQPGSVVQIPTVAALQAGNFGNTPNINLGSYATVGDGGAGTLTPCTGTCTVDNGVVFQDAAGNKFVRQFKGPVKMPWYGVVDATSSGCLANMAGCDVSAAVAAAFVSSLTYGDGGVTTAGRTINASFSIPTYQYFTCDGPPGGSQNQTTGSTFYWTLPNSVVHSTGTTITMNKSTRLTNCFVRPTYYVPTVGGAYNIPIQSINDLRQVTHLFAGTGVTCIAESCNIDNLTVMGFDRCIDASASTRTVHSNIVADCNIAEWGHNNGGGFKSENLFARDFMTVRVHNAGGQRLSPAQWQASNIAVNGGDGIAVTINTDTFSCSPDPFCVTAGDNVLLSGFGQLISGVTSGDTTSSSNTIINIPTGQGGSFGSADIQVGFLIVDGSGCVPASTYVGMIDVDPNTGFGTASMVDGSGNTVNATCTKQNDVLTFSNNSVAPPINELLPVVSVSNLDATHEQLVLGNVSWSGPTYPAAWNTGTNVVSASDGTGVLANQFFCLSGTAPFCTPPSGWTFNTTTSSNINSLGASGVGEILAGSTANWPANTIGYNDNPIDPYYTGIVLVGTEQMLYTIDLAGSINIIKRGFNNTTAASHANNSTLQAAVPQIMRVVPTVYDQANYHFILNAYAQNTSGASVHFANNTAVVTGGTLGSVALNFSYKVWSATPGAGPPLDGAMNVTAASSVGTGSGCGTSTSTLTLTNWGGKVMEGQTVTDITNGTNIPAKTVVCSVSGNVVTISNVPTSFLSDVVFFDNCGWPGLETGISPAPWAGNCIASGVLAGDYTGPQNDTQGAVFDYPHPWGWRYGIVLNNAPATEVSIPVLSGGGGQSQNLDPMSASVFLRGKGDKDHISTGRLNSGQWGVIDEITTQRSGLAFGTLQTQGDFIFGPNANVALSAVHGAPGNSIGVTKGGFGYIANGATVAMAGNNLGLWSFSVDLLAESPNVSCAGNIVLPPLCSDLSSQTFIPAGASTSTTIANFADRVLSIRDFGGVPDWTTNSTSALVAAEAAAVAQGVHTILLDGDSRGSGYVFGTHTVPANIQLVCPGPITAPPTSNDYRNYPQSILLSTTAGLSFSAGSGMHDCNVLQNALANSTPPATFQDNYTRAQSFTGTAITVTGDNVVIDSGNIIGFNIGLLTKGSRQLTFHDLNIDAATVCYQIFNQGGGGTHQGYNLQCSPYATRFGTLAEPQFPLSSITDNGSGVAQAHLTSPCTGTNCILNGYKVWINSGSNANAQSVYGLATAANVTSSTIDLVGLSSAFFNGGQTETVTTTTGSTYVSGAATNFAQIQPTQAVAGTCVSGGTTVAQIVPPGLQNYTGFWLSAPATTTGSCTVTISDTSPATVVISGVAIGNSGGTGYQVGDQVSPSTGTGTQAIFDVNEVDGGASGGPGVVTRLGLNDGGSYTVAPSPLTNSPTTGGSGTGLTVNLSTGASLYGSATVRNGPAFSFSKVTDVRINNCGELSHTTGMQFGLNAHAILVTNCSLHDENVLQAPNAGIAFTSNSNNNKLDHVDSYYFGPAVLCDSLALSNLGANVVSGSSIGGSAGNSGLQNTIFAIGSPTPGTNSKASCTLVGNATTVIGTVVVMGDERSVNLGDNSFNNSTIVTQNAAAQNLITGAGNTLANGSAPVYAVKAPNYITPGSLNESGGQKNLNNASTTFTPYSDGSSIFDTGALTNNRGLTLSNTGATAGFSVKVIRTGSSGGFVRNVFQNDGTTLITAMADGTSATFVFNSVTSLWVKQ